jgi:hypothetical protein
MFQSDASVLAMEHKYYWCLNEFLPISVDELNKLTDHSTIL